MPHLHRLLTTCTIGLLLMPSIATCDAAETASIPGICTVRQEAGRWWLVDDAGERFLSLGVTTVQFAQDRIQGTDISPYADANRKKYGGEPAWIDAAARRLMDLGFNTMGAWSDARLATIEHQGQRLRFTENADLGAAFVGLTDPGSDAWLHGRFPDVFDPRWDGFVRDHARQRCGGFRGNRQLIGWFTDNELSWGPDWRHGDELLVQFLNLPRERGGATAARAHLRQRYAGDWAAFERVWVTGASGWEAWELRTQHQAPFKRPPVWDQNGPVERMAIEGDPRREAFVGDAESFTAELAERYFATTAAALEAADPGRLNFGSRFAYVPGKPVIATAAKHLDGISFNCYDLDPRGVIGNYTTFGKPMIIGEFSFRGRDSGLPNTKGAGPVVDTQTQRADAYERYVRLAVADPQVIGLHWFEHADEPKEGRFDGENSNYGIVTINDDPYVELQERMRRMNRLLPGIHAGDVEAGTAK